MPAPPAAGTGMRAAGWLLLSAQVAQVSEIKQLLALMAQLAALTDAVTRCREAQVRHRWERLLLALVANRTVQPCLKLAAARWFTCVAVIPGLTATHEDQAYRARNLLVGVDAHPEV